MPQHLLVYASTSTIPSACAKAEVDRIVAGSCGRNAAIGVTGTLLHSETHFAQAIEGDEASVHRLMDDIRRDVRHKDIVVLMDLPIKTRRFEGWSLGYSGQSLFVSQLISRAIHEADHGSDRGLRDLIRLMESFASAEKG